MLNDGLVGGVGREVLQVPLVQQEGLGEVVKGHLPPLKDSGVLVLLTGQTGCRPLTVKVMGASGFAVGHKLY